MFRIGSTILRNSSVPEREGGGGGKKGILKIPFYPLWCLQGVE